jgi:pantoate--beta-alanine ligase
VRILHSIADLRAALQPSRCIGLVPTMGNLHSGHLSLVQQARQRGGIVVASIFVNQLQFAPNEDFDRYPRTLERDCQLLAAAGCDIVFAPDAEEMYPEPQLCKVHPPPALADVLEGEFRPGFFVGVSTVVLKLFGIVNPSHAVFGKKDYQQLLVVKNMVRQFALPVEIIAADTVREPDGLALSSRNGYLDASQRVQAAQLSEALRTAASQLDSGHGEPRQIEIAALEWLRARGWLPDYVAIRRRKDLSVPAREAGAELGSLVVLAAARLGQTRLIDNWEV